MRRFGPVLALMVVAAVLLAVFTYRPGTHTPDPSGRPGPRGDLPAAASGPDSAQTAAALRAARPPRLPDPALTPGAVLAVTARDICEPGYATRVRNVPQSVKRRAYAEYGITSRKPGEYEVDHLISLQLGGSNALSNLWPQSYRTVPWNAGVKDRLENELHRLVCAGQLDLGAAQREIAGDWTAAYRRHFGPPPADGGPSARAGRGREVE